MLDRRRHPSAEERLAERRRDLALLRKKRMAREIAGPIFRRMVTIVPVFFRREGKVVARRMLSEPRPIIDALREHGVFALDTAMRVAYGFGFLSGGDVEVYLVDPAPLDHLAAAGLISSDPHPDTVLVRPWRGPPRLLVCLVDALPQARVVNHDHRVVTPERLRRELIGAVGARADLFALLERAEKKQTSHSPNTPP